MSKTFQIVAYLLVVVSAAYGQEKLEFHSLEEIYAYADNHSYTLRNDGQQRLLAKYQTLAGKWGKWNLQGRTTFTLTDNTKLNTSFIPAEIFGGPAGTFQPVTFGQKYQNNVTFAPQIDLINPYAAALIKANKTNEQLTAVTNLMNKKALYESISAAYHNILSYQTQIGITGESLSNADTLAAVLKHRQVEGLARNQDVNTALANRLAVKDKLQQLEVQLAQQYNSLKILADIDSAKMVSILIKASVESTPAPAATGDLLQRQAEWQTKFQEATMRADKRWIYPTVSLFSSFGWQQTTNGHFFDSSTWYGTSFIGLRLTIPLLPEVSKIISVKYDRVNLQIARNNWQHNILQDNINNRQLELECRKAYQSYRLSLEVEALRKDTYYKNLKIYKEGILSTTDLINSFEDWLNSSLQSVALLAATEHARNKIIISNQIK
jgi:outer membrane protein